MTIPISVMRKLNARLIILLDDILIMTSTTKICVTSMPDFTDSRCEKNSKDECITSAGKEGQNYFTMSSYFKTKITFCKGVDKGVRSSLFHSHSSVSSSSSVLSNSKIKIAELASTKKFDSMIVLTEEARKELQ